MKESIDCIYPHYLRCRLCLVLRLGFRFQPPVVRSERSTVAGLFAVHVYYNLLICQLTDTNLFVSLSISGCQSRHRNWH